MQFSLKHILLGVVTLLVIVVIVDAIRFYLVLRKAKELSENAGPFERSLTNAEMNILVLGDSTAVGTGVKDKTLSTAGRLSQLYPEASVRNRAVNGLKLGGLLDIIDTIGEEERFSIILVQIGANDIMRMTSMRDIETDAEKVLARLSKQTDRLVILHSGNIGETSFFPFYMRPLLSKRSLEVRDIYMKLAGEYGAKYVDLVNSSVGEQLRGNPGEYYAEDGLHLSDAGYGLWFEEIKKVLKQ